MGILGTITSKQYEADLYSPFQILRDINSCHCLKIIHFERFQRLGVLIWMNFYNFVSWDESYKKFKTSELSKNWFHEKSRGRIFKFPHCDLKPMMETPAVAQSRRTRCISTELMLLQNWVDEFWCELESREFRESREFCEFREFRELWITPAEDTEDSLMDLFREPLEPAFEEWNSTLRMSRMSWGYRLWFLSLNIQINLEFRISRLLRILGYLRWLGYLEFRMAWMFKGIDKDLPALEVEDVEYLWYDLLSLRSETFIKRGFGVLKMLLFSWNCALKKWKLV